MAGNVALPFFGPDPLDWERPSAAAFPTWLNQNDGGAGASLVDGTGGKPLVLKAGLNSSAYSICGVLKPAPTPPWTITVALAGNKNYVSGVLKLLPIILQSTDLKFAATYWGNNKGVWFDDADNSDIGTPTNGNLDDFNSGFAFSDYFAWFKTVHTGSELEFYFSPEGQDWDQLNLSGSALDFLGDVAKVGFGLDRSSNNAGFFGYSKLWSWVES